MKTKQIDSPSNDIFKKLFSLTKSKGVAEHGQCLISGEKVIAEVATTQPTNAFWIFTSEEHELFDKFKFEQLILLPKKLFDELNLVGAPAPLLCVDIPQEKPWDGTAPLAEHELLCALGDPNNLGALLRSARAFGIKNVVLLEEACHPFHPKAVKASAGAAFHLNFFKGPSIQSLAETYKAAPAGNSQIIALDGTGKSLSEFIFEGHYRILLGEEGLGIPKNLTAQKVSVPISSEVESLNATVAASILLYELSIS